MNIFQQTFLLLVLASKCCDQASSQTLPTLAPSKFPTEHPTKRPTKNPTPAPTKPPEIDVYPSKMNFGSDFEVEFYNPGPNTSNWIGIFSKYGGTEALLSSNTCGKKNEEGEKKSKGGGKSKKSKKSKCSPKESGTIDFSISGPDLNDASNMPLNPGKYKACLMEGKNTRIVCSNFEIDDIPQRDIYRTSLTPTNDKFGYGEGASVSFSSNRSLPVNAWIGIFGADDVNNNSKDLPKDSYTYARAYAGCNNRDGNESEQKACSIRKRYGTVDNFYGLIPVGTYRFCLSFFSNRPYTAFKCSDSFTVKAPKLEIPSFIPFGSDINVRFTNDFPSKLNWVAILGNNNGKNKEEQELWGSMCGDKDSWNSNCSPKYDGTITFSGADPNQEQNQKWPINPGQKTVCMYGGRNYGGKDGYLKLVCKDFIVQGIPDTVLSSTYVTTSSDRFKFREPITATFDTPIAYPNTWIGIYKASDISKWMSELPDEKPKFWVYSSCNNKNGNQIESDSCELKKSSGNIQIGWTYNEKHWPISPDTFRVCMSLYSNPPFTRFVCSENSFFVEPEQCKDDPNFTFTLKDRVTNVPCGWIDEQDILPFQRENRVKTWCGEKSAVLNKCRVSCNKCQKCQDDEKYKWKIDDGTKQGCRYIHEDGITSAQVENRLRRWCNPSIGDNKLLECPKSCGECIPQCKDEEFFKWKIDNGTKQGCGYIHEDGITPAQVENRLRRWCNPSIGDNKLLECPKSCGTCIPTPDPTPISTLAPSSVLSAPSSS